jgi:hypothetical protein
MGREFLAFESREADADTILRAAGTRVGTSHGSIAVNDPAGNPQVV